LIGNYRLCKLAESAGLPTLAGMLYQMAREAIKNTGSGCLCNGEGTKEPGSVLQIKDNAAAFGVVTGWHHGFDQSATGREESGDRKGVSKRQRQIMAQYG